MDNEFSNRINDIKVFLESQKQQIRSLDETVNALGEADISRLDAELRGCREELEAASRELASAKAENKQLRNTLYEQLFNEKIHLLKNSQRVMEIYFAKSKDDSEETLFTFEAGIRSRIDKIKGLLKTELLDDKEGLEQQAQQLEETLSSAIKNARARSEALTAEQIAAARAGYAEMEEAPLTEEQMKRRLKQNNVEAAIGSKVANTAGMILILLGVIFGLQYTYTTLIVSAPLRSAFAFLIGLVLLAGGEFRNRKERNPFSIGLTAGGIGILFAAAAVSYFNLHVLTMYPALIICVLVAVLSFFLSVRYGSQTIGCFALIGGYLPIFSLESGRLMAYSALTYFLILNFLAIFIASKRKWVFLNFLSFLLNSAGMFYILFILNPWYEHIPANVGIPYLFVNFIMYMSLILVNPYFKKTKLSRADVVLLCLNTVLSSGLVYLFVYYRDIVGLNGIFAIIFCVMYYAFGLFVDKKIIDKRVSGFYYLTSLTFAVLVVPLQLGRFYLTLGWLVEAILLICYGVIKKDKKYERPGLAVFALCIFSFFYMELLYVTDTELLIRYAAITMGSVIVMASYWNALESDLLRYSRAGRRVMFVFSNIAAVNGWLFLCYLTAYTIGRMPRDAFGPHYAVYSWLIPVVTMVTIFYAYFCTHFKYLKGKVAKYTPVFFYAVSILLCLAANSTFYGYPGTKWLALIILIAYNILTILAVWELISIFVSGRRLSFEWLPIVVSVFTLLVTVQLMVVQLSMEFTSMVISFVCMLFALAWIIAGFKLRYPSMRRLGLGLSLTATAKLFIFDLFFLNAWQRIISFLGMGIVLVGISYVYRVVKKKQP